MNGRDDGGPAFPEKQPTSQDWPGMTLRDYFAAKAMQELMSQDAYQTMSEVASDAYAQADAMIEARTA